MKSQTKKIVETADGSSTLYMETINEYYHSKHGAVQEAKHVYLKNGFEFWKSIEPGKKRCNVFEMGFGTGLNVLLTYLAHLESSVEIYMQSLEAYPLNSDVLKGLNFNSFLPNSEHTVFDKIHTSSWDERIKISPEFTLHKIHQTLEKFTPEESIDVIYYDAFGSRAQPEMWDDSCFTKLVEAMSPGAVFVTYAAKGSVRRALDRLGLTVELVPGPPGKREMIRAYRQL